MTPQMALGPLVDVVVAALHIEEPLSLELGPEGFDTGMQGTSQHALAFATNMCKHSLPTCTSIRYQHVQAFATNIAVTGQTSPGRSDPWSSRP